MTQSKHLLSKNFGFLKSAPDTNRFKGFLFKPPIWIILLALVSSSCSEDWFSLPSILPPSTLSNPQVAPPDLLPEAEITFRVEIPLNTPEGQPVYLNVLDEVTGLAINAQSYLMYEDDRQHYIFTLPSPVGSVIKYRYSREGATSMVDEHVSDGRQVRYRLYHVEGPGTVQDVISRWTDTQFDLPTGRISGQATSSVGEQPIPNLLITAGGAQAVTASDGSFLLEGLPPATHNLVAYALDGSYRTYQQGALVAADSTTPTPLSLTAAPMVSVEFVVIVPDDTIPAVPIRLAGNLYQLGNTFADLAGGVSTLSSRMPTFSLLPDGRHSLTLSLPAGADIRYLYTLGDGFWNTEYTSSGGLHLRRIIIPEGNTIIEDTVESWNSVDQNTSAPITFDVVVPADTPANDYVSIQFNPFYGWTEPIPMWSLGNNRWAYILNSPLHLFSSFSYRFCRNDQCGSADDVNTIGEMSSGLSANTSPSPQTIIDQVDEWAWLNPEPSSVDFTDLVTARDTNFIAGVEFQSDYHPSWMPRLPNTLDDISALGANWVILSPGWTYTRVAQPILEPIMGRDPLWFDLTDSIIQSRARGFKVALYPVPHFLVGENEWWETATRDFSWWVVWFERYRNFALHHADLAARANAQNLILGGEWLTPALPNGTLSNGSPSGVPADSDSRWRTLLQEVRTRFDGSISWALPYSQVIENTPTFLDAVDQIYLLWSAPLSSHSDPTVDELQIEASRLLDNNLLPLQALYNKPMVLSVAYASADGASTACLPDSDGDCLKVDTLARPKPDIPNIQIDLQEQADIYEALLKAVNERGWISGFVTRSYYPPAALRDKSASIHGKPAQNVIAYWFPRLLGVISP